MLKTICPASTANSDWNRKKKKRKEKNRKQTNDGMHRRNATRMALTVSKGQVQSMGKKKQITSIEQQPRF